MANITLSADKDLIERARQVARRQGTSLNELVRGYLRALVGEESGIGAGDEQTPP
jgi:predicted HicB family RNase H-like nuclease